MASKKGDGKKRSKLANGGVKKTFEEIRAELGGAVLAGNLSNKQRKLLDRQKRRGGGNTLRLDQL